MAMLDSRPTYQKSTSIVDLTTRSSQTTSMRPGRGGFTEVIATVTEKHTFSATFPNYTDHTLGRAQPTVNSRIYTMNQNGHLIVSFYKKILPEYPVLAVHLRGLHFSGARDPQVGQVNFSFSKRKII